MMGGVFFSSFWIGLDWICDRVVDWGSGVESVVHRWGRIKLMGWKSTDKMRDETQPVQSGWKR